MPRAPHELDAAELRELLDELVRRVESRGITGAIRIVGGAALALVIARAVIESL